MAWSAGIEASQVNGPGEQGGFLRVRAATTGGQANTISLAPFKLTGNVDNAFIILDDGPGNTGGAISGPEIAATGLSVAVTLGSSGAKQTNLLIVGEFSRV